MATTLNGVTLGAITVMETNVYQPSQMFANGEQGVWYDPSDISTLYQDDAGTTPVTAVEQTVGRMLDKSGNDNHATQATLANRPTLSARVNLLTKTEQFNDAAWTKLNATITPDDTTDPLGGSTADALVENTTSGNHQVTSASTLGSAAPHTLSCYFKAGTRSWAVLNFPFQANAYAFYDIANGVVGLVGPGSTATITNAGNGWYRATLTFTITAARAVEVAAASANGVVSYAGVTSAKAIYIWGADLRVANDGVNVPPYQRVNTATDYDTVGFPMYLRFDGSNDAMATSSIDFTSTSGVSFFAGVCRFSSSTLGIVVELSATWASNNGAFVLQAPSGGGADTYFAGSRGTAALNSSTQGVQASGYEAPITNTLSSSNDIFGDATTFRISGVTLSPATGDKGSGNFGNYPLYIGARAGTGSFFNGRLYSLIVRGAQSTSAEIASIENYVNSKTKAF